MSPSEEHDSSEDLWLTEIIRETDHYYQGEIQQEQRASWILASVCVLLALIVALQLQLGDKLKTPTVLVVLTQISLYLSGMFSILTIIPLRGTSMKRDLFGQSYRHYKNMEIKELMEAKFRFGNRFLKDNYKNRVYYHFRSHFLRVRLKEYGVIWSSVFLLLGFIFLGLVGLFELFS